MDDLVDSEKVEKVKQKKLLRDQSTGAVVGQIRSEVDKLIHQGDLYSLYEVLFNQGDEEVFFETLIKIRGADFYACTNPTKPSLREVISGSGRSSLEIGENWWILCHI